MEIWHCCMNVAMHKSHISQYWCRSFCRKDNGLQNEYTDYILARFLNGIFSRLNGLAIIMACTVEDFLENRAYQPWLLFDYYFREYRKSVESLWRKGSTLFGPFALKLCNTNETLANTGFPVLRPDNSDSKGRWFESSQAYHQKALAFASAFCFELAL